MIPRAKELSAAGADAIVLALRTEDLRQAGEHIRWAATTIVPSIKSMPSRRTAGLEEGGR